MKYEWKKNDKTLYLPKAVPSVIDVPPASYFMLNGKGNPNHSDFEDAIGVLYSLSYTLKMLPKKGVTPEGYFDYTVFPLEGIWDLEEDARHAAVLNKDKLVYTIMIRQPDFVTESLALEVIETVSKKKPHPLLGKVTFGKLEEGLCVQMMHHGPYDDEPASFAKMEQYCEEQGLKRSSKLHKEIYISDARKTPPEKLKTVLRFRAGRN
ncbi:GyrI-like domain-containing protein [Paenibacillus glycanilyticus]|uniref:GyrI-like domain-containing protein n=1 Tax=Paenibacillus glycanilyticus TaxID=126569 RepID=UPI002040B5C6|nr:GyrI-like domain-containing protein [Paenibacillus glycanilyticus]MCM3631322.1 GyrI-like domain-containing protein [Paenibacillus glycanilyticus]